jgi:D-xylose transport system permease protein
MFVLVFLILAVFFHLASDGVFFTPRNLSILLRQAAIVAIVGAGVAMLMIKGEIDLSIGSSVFLCGVVVADLQANREAPLWAALVAAMVVGILLGAIHGAWVVVLGIPSFVATLAGLLAWRGVGLFYTNAGTIGPLDDTFSAISEAFVPRGLSVALIGLGIAAVWAGAVRGRLGGSRTPIDWPVVVGATIGLLVLAWIVSGFQGLPLAVLWVVVVAATLTFVMMRTTFGRSAYLLGANREAALYAGIPVRRTLFLGFLIMGAVYGVAGILLTARLGTSTPGAGEFLELDAIAAAVIGGVALRGGIGTIPGAVVGALLLTTINNGMSILNVSSFLQLVIKGFILVAALALDAYAQRRAGRRRPAGVKAVGSTPETDTIMEGARA